MFSGDYTPGNLSQWEVAQNYAWNNPPGTATSLGTYAVQVLAGGPTQGSHAARFELRDGDIPNFGGGERTELSSSAPGATVKDGDELWIEQSIKFDSTFVCPTDWFLVQQWRSGPNSPAAALNVNSSCALTLGNNVSGVNLPIGNIGKGAWHKYVIHAKFTQSAGTGWVEVWQDGVQKIQRTGMQLMDASTGYLKQGIYRSAALSSTAIVSHSGLRIYKVG